MNFSDQAEKFLTEISNRKSGPIRLNTLHVYRSLLSTRILPCIGGKDLASVGNKTVKSLVGRLAEAKLSPATINLAVYLVKAIVNSVTDEEGEPLYPRKWNSTFIDVPRLDPDSQKAPICTRKALSQSISRTNGEVKALVAILAGTGLRIGEALTLSTLDDQIDNLYDPEAGTILVRSTMVDGKAQPDPKTRAGNRVIDLDPSLNIFLRSQFQNLEGRLFRSSQRTFRRQISALGIQGFHSLRRFRITHLQGMNTPPALTKFWAGHAASDITERYTKMGSQIDVRKSWSGKVGLGFEL